MLYEVITREAGYPLRCSMERDWRDGMFNQEVQITFTLAVREAQRRHHEYLTIEHVLFAMLYDENGQRIITNCSYNFV